jgi:uncharacterized membrane protein YhiD involved in acid resistance
LNELLYAIAQGDGVSQLGAEAILLYLLVAFLLGQLLAWVYMWTHHGLSYSRSHVQSLVLLSLIVTIVMLAVGNNLARAFGLFGALALVRFRTPIKDTRDTAFLFMAVGVGIGVGSQNVLIAVVGTVLLCLIVLYLYWAGFGSKYAHDALLRFSMPAGAEQDSALRRILREHCRHFALVHMRATGPDSPVEFAYQVKLNEPESAAPLLGSIEGMQGVRSASLLLQDEDSEV